MTPLTMTRWGGVAALVGALLWAPVRYFITFSWDNPMLGLDYRAWNSLVPLPVLLMLLGTLALRARYGRSIGRLGRAGLVVTAIGLAGMAAGAIVEFWWAGGLSGNRDGAVIGWTLYLASYALVLTLGLWTFGIALLRSPGLRAWGVVPLVMGAITLAWPVTIALGFLWLGTWSPPLVGLGWLLAGCVLLGNPARLAGRNTRGQRAGGESAVAP